MKSEAGAEGEEDEDEDMYNEDEVIKVRGTTSRAKKNAALVMKDEKQEQPVENGEVSR